MNEIAPSAGGLPGRRIGNFQIARLLGRGGMGEVYLAQDVSLGRPVALKVLRGNFAHEPQLVQRFHREARAAAQLSHPHIVQIHAVGTVDGIPYIAMEFVDGSPLDAVLREHGALPWQRALTITGQTASALEMAHARGIIHRDIKPANILIDTNGRARVTDFGVAKVMSAGTQLTSDGTLIGTPEYMSPEQCGVGQVGPASDLFSLGAMLYEMLTGSLPFKGETYAGVIRSVTQDTPRPLDDLVVGVPASVVFLVGKMLEKNPAQRYGTAAELLADLSRIAAGSAPLIEVTAQPVPAAPAREGGGGENWSTVRNLAVAGAAAGFVIVASFYALRTGQPQESTGATDAVSHAEDASAAEGTAPSEAGPPQNVPPSEALSAEGILPPAPPPEGSPARPPDEQGPPPRLTAEEILSRHDANRNGVIEMSEIPPEVRPHLMRADVSGDQILSRQELEALANSRPPLPGPQGPPPPRRGPPPPRNRPGPR